MAEWIQTSRLPGVLRYHWKSIGKLVVWGLLIVLAVQTLSLLTPLVVDEHYYFDGIRGNFEIVFFGAFIIGILTAGRSTRFLLRFGTPRTSVWLGNIIGLLAGMIGLLLATFLLNMLFAALLFPMSGLRPDAYTMSADRFWGAFNDGLANLPELMLYTLEWTAIFYLYACLLRRFKAVTISLSIAVPLLFIVLMMIPAVREALSVVQGEDQGQMVLLGLKWLQVLQDILRFIEEHWDALQLTAGIASLPLSYLVMRGTKQP